MKYRRDGRLNNQNMHVAFYPSGHGYGHSVRTSLVTEKLLEMGVSVTIIASTPSFLFENCLQRSNFKFRAVQSWKLDPGVVQQDAIKVDIHETQKRLAEFMLHVDKRVDEETQWLKDEQIDIVCSDATFVCFPAAQRLGKKAILVGNFTWDVILDAYCTDKTLIERVSDMYSKATHWIKTPGDIPCPCLESVPKLNVDIIARRPISTAEEVRRRFSLQDRKVVTLSFGGHYLDIAGNSANTFSNSHNNVQSSTPKLMEIPQGWHCIVTGVDTNVQWPNFTFVSHNQVYLPDVLLVSDVIVTKLGFATCTEIMAICRGLPSRKAVLYVKREGFVEEEGLLNMLKQDSDRLFVDELSFHAFVTGFSNHVLEASLHLDVQEPLQTKTFDGDLQAANLIMQIHKD
jgi:hypothetical protein